ncbi:hypothetical protein EYC80_001009 [Monilinia laxa]|uniref:Uncharacterized protein n=1 Tax=Monilinia laxa TaxID=61186 RepID=A0A5N6K7U1_MONLA|nr:hypothetical protein EYC80_001009 [Monilinia laxa]
MKAHSKETIEEQQEQQQQQRQQQQQQQQQQQEQLNHLLSHKKAGHMNQSNIFEREIFIKLLINRLNFQYRLFITIHCLRAQTFPRQLYELIITITYKRVSNATTCPFYYDKRYQQKFTILAQQLAQHNWEQF